MEIVSVTLGIVLCFVSVSCSLSVMNTYSTFSISTYYFVDNTHTVHYTAKVVGEGVLLEEFSGLSMRAVLTEAAEYIQTLVDRYCDHCSRLTDEHDESMRNCGICLPCYDRMMAKR